MIVLIEWWMWYNIKVICTEWYEHSRVTYTQYKFKDSDIMTYLESSWLQSYVSELMVVQQHDDVSTALESPYATIGLSMVWYWEHVSPSYDLDWASCCTPKQKCQCTFY